MLTSHYISWILLLFLLDSYSSGDLVYKQKYTSVFVEKGEDVVLNCTCCLHNESSWSGPKISSVTKTSENEEETYAAGLMLNPILHNLNIEIIGDNYTNDCSLVITNLSEVGVGHYICEYWKSGIFYIHNFTVNLKTPANNLTFLNTFKKGQQKHIRGFEGRILDIICTVNSGKPPETLVLTENGSTIQSGKSCKMVYSFLPSKNDNMKSFECSAVSDTLEKPLTDQVILDIQYRPEPPNNITVVNYENHMIVSWIPGFNGGSDQIFFIQHRNADAEWWITTGPIKYSFANRIKYTIYELESNKQYFVCMFSRNVIGDSEKTNVTEASNFKYEQITPPVYNNCTVVIVTIVGGMLICCIVSHIYCHLRRKRRPDAIVEISQEGQYGEIGTINYNDVMVAPINNFKLDNNDNVSNVDKSNDVLSSAGENSSNASSFIGQTGDGYENAYQAITPSVIEMHQYSGIIPNIYQNTIISPKSAVTTTAEYINTAMDNYTKP